MQVEELCELHLRYDEDGVVVARPFGPDGEGQAFGMGTGRAEGRISGTVRWANFPRRRSDGVFLPDIRGAIATADGDVLFEMHGISLVPDEHDRRHLVGTARFVTEIADLRFLLDSVAVFEGSLDVESGDIRIPVRRCVPDRDAD